MLYLTKTKLFYIKMSKDEFYVKLNDIVNFAYNLGETYDDLKIFRKILRSLTEDFRLEVTVIIESKDINTILVEELVGSLWTYELDFPKTSKQKSTALKIVDETILLMMSYVHLMLLIWQSNLKGS